MFDIENKEIVDYILNNNATIRETAQHFGMSRQTICNRMKQTKNKEVQNLFNEHFKNKYIKALEKQGKWVNKIGK